MDPITVTHLVQDRTQDLQRIADQVRQERSLRSTAHAEATASTAAAEATPPSPIRTTEPRREPAHTPARPAEQRLAPAAAPANAAVCDVAEPAA